MLCQQLSLERLATIAVSGNKHRFSDFQLWNDILLKVWNGAFCGELKRFSIWWGNIERTAPNVDLLVAIFLSGSSLIEALKIAIHPFI